MEFRHTFSQLFFIRRERINKLGKAPIYLRITVDGKRAEVSLKQYIDPNKWDSHAGRAKGTKQEIRELNAYLDNIREKINQHYRSLKETDSLITAKILKNRFLGLYKSRRTLLEVFEYHNKDMKEEVGKTYAQATYDRFTTTLDHTKKFLLKKYNQDDIFLSNLEYSFITDFEHYFKTEKNCNHNTTAKYLKNVRKIVNIAVNNGWLDKDPFANYKIKIEPSKITFLSQDELERIENKAFKIQRLELVKDIFLFSCYTALSYIDLIKLTKNKISEGVDGRLWIFSERTKTKNPSNVPLTPKALKIKEKYENYPGIVDTDKVIPSMSNQKLNTYLKEIADVCEINKTLTFHMARHTFATTITLLRGVPIESVSKMMGHKSLRTTQIYSKVLDQKVSEDMQIVIDEEEKETFKNIENERKA